MIVAVTGATGYLGSFLLHALAGGGHSVRAWRRASSDLTGLPGGIDWIEGDLGSRDSMRALVAGADALVHAALDHAPGRYRGGEGGDLAGALMTNVGGSLALLAEAQAAGLRRAVVVSSRAALDGHVAEGMIGDEAPPAPTTHYGAAKAALEGFGASFSAEGFPVAAIRPTGIYGFREPPAKSKWWDIVGQALRGEAVAARSATEVHGADVAKAVARAPRRAGRADRRARLQPQRHRSCRTARSWNWCKGRLASAARCRRRVPFPASPCAATRSRRSASVSAGARFWRKR